MTTHRIDFDDTSRQASAVTRDTDSRYAEALDDTTMAIRYLSGVVTLLDELLDELGGADRNRVAAKRYWVNTALECARRA